MNDFEAQGGTAFARAGSDMWQCEAMASSLWTTRRSATCCRSCKFSERRRGAATRCSAALRCPCSASRRRRWCPARPSRSWAPAPRSAAAEPGRAPTAPLRSAGTGLGEAFMTTGENGDYEAPKRERGRETSHRMTGLQDQKVWPSEGGHKARTSTLPASSTCENWKQEFAPRQEGSTNLQTEMMQCAREA